MLTLTVMSDIQLPRFAKLPFFY